MVPITVDDLPTPNPLASPSRPQVSELYRRDDVGMLMEEAQEVVEQREQLAEMVTALKRAQAILTEVRDTSLP
jgi:hypothetical protein